MGIYSIHVIENIPRKWFRTRDVVVPNEETVPLLGGAEGAMVVHGGCLDLTIVVSGKVAVPGKVTVPGKVVVPSKVVMPGKVEVPCKVVVP